MYNLVVVPLNKVNVLQYLLYLFIHDFKVFIGMLQLKTKHKTKDESVGKVTHPSPLIPPLSMLLLTQILNLHCILYGLPQHWIWGRGGL